MQKQGRQNHELEDNIPGTGIYEAVTNFCGGLIQNKEL